jgi:hypothetical protein
VKASTVPCLPSYLTVLFHLSVILSYYIKKQQKNKTIFFLPRSIYSCAVAIFIAHSRWLTR